MFKCTECEKIYDIKPDYCDDCGNDVFEEIVKTAPAPEKPAVNNVQKEEVRQETKIEYDEIKPAPKQKAEKPKKEIDYPSISFLAVCLLISLYIIFFAWNPKPEDMLAQTPKDNEVKQNTNIPSSVNGFWNNELPKVQPKTTVKAPEQVVEEPKQLQIEQVQPQPVIAKAPEVKKAPQAVQQTPKPAPQVQKQTQPVSKPAPVQQKPASTTQKQQQKPVQTTTPTQTKPAQPKQTQTQAQTNPAKTQTTQTQTKPTQTQPVWQSVQQPQTQPVQQKPVQTVDTSALKKELADYKVNLRNTIGRKIDFANVIGDGSCTVSFKIASSGKIINRAFSQQSTNTTLNDAVYAAVMATPSYNPPPSGYNNETMYLKISFYNGNFQISLK